MPSIDQAGREEWALLCRMRMSSPEVCKRLAPPAGSLISQVHEDVLEATLRAAEMARLDGARTVGVERVRRVLADMAPRWATGTDRSLLDRALEHTDTADEWGIRRRVIERRNAKAVRSLADDLVARVVAAEPYADVLEALERIRTFVPEPTQPGGRPWVFSARQLAEATLHHLQETRDRPKVTAGLIGPAVASLPPGALCIIGGDTNTGKSQLMLYLALAFDRAGRKVGVISLEDPAHVWGDRVQAAYSGVSLLSAARRSESLTREQWGDVEFAIQNLERCRIELAIMPTSLIGRVVDEMRAMCADGCEVVFVDYVQEVSDPEREDDRRLMITAAARALKGVAKECGVPLFLGSQLARASGRVRGNEPTSQSLKESGDLENMAEQILLLWRESDETDAPTLGKISKDKCSGERARFRLERATCGAITDIRPHDPGPQAGVPKW